MWFVEDKDKGGYFVHIGANLNRQLNRAVIKASLRCSVYTPRMRGDKVLFLKYSEFKNCLLVLEELVSSIKETIKLERKVRSLAVALSDIETVLKQCEDETVRQLKEKGFDKLKSEYRDIKVKLSMLDTRILTYYRDYFLLCYTSGNNKVMIE